MTANQEQSDLERDEQIRDAQRSEILAIIKQDGPCTVSHIVRATGFDPWEIRSHCESLVESEDVEFKLWRYQA